MELFEKIKDFFREFIKENSKISITIAAIMVVLSLSAVLVGISQCSVKLPSKPVVLPADGVIDPVDSFFDPQKTPPLESYYFSRESREEWEQEEVDRWFEEPSQKNVDNLDKANDKVIDKILGAAP